MNKAQPTAGLTMRIARITTVEDARTLVQRAFRVTGLSNATSIRDSDMDALLQVLGTEGGAIQAMAEQIAIYGGGHGPIAA